MAVDNQQNKNNLQQQAVDVLIALQGSLRASIGNFDQTQGAVRREHLEEIEILSTAAIGIGETLIDSEAQLSTQDANQP